MQRNRSDHADSVCSTTRLEVLQFSCVERATQWAKARMLVTCGAWLFAPEAYDELAA